VLGTSATSTIITPMPLRGEACPCLANVKPSTVPATVPAASQRRPVPANVTHSQSMTGAMCEMSLTKIRLPEIDGAGHVGLSATVYVFIGSNPPGVLRAIISCASSFITNARVHATHSFAMVIKVGRNKNRGLARRHRERVRRSKTFVSYSDMLRPGSHNRPQIPSKHAVRTV